MADNVRFIRTTKAKWVNRDSYDMNALYFLTDTREFCRGDQLLSDGARIVESYAALPEFDVAADGILYFTQDTHNAYIMNPERDGWIQAIYGTVTDINAVPEEEAAAVIPTVAAVLGVEQELKTYVSQTALTTDKLVPVDGTIVVTDQEDGCKALGVSISPKEGNALVTVDGGLFVPVASTSEIVAGDGIAVDDGVVSVKLAETTHGLVAVDGTLSLNLATKDSDGAMSKEDKKVLDAIPSVYVARKYEIAYKPEGTLVDYRDKEIRVMCPADTTWTIQNSGENADANMYYIGFKAYAPMDAVSFKEDLKETVEDDTMYYFEGNDFAGTNSDGRKYSIVWLPTAKNTDGVWTYYGSVSDESKYIGWHYSVEWFNEAGVKIGTDTIRINLSNEACHNNVKPYYVANYATAEELEAVKGSIADIKGGTTWEEF